MPALQVDAATEGTRCIFCRGRVETWADTRNEFGHYVLVRCANCGSAFVHPRPSLREIESFYLSRNDSDRHMTPAEVLAAEERYPNSTIDAQRIIAQVTALGSGGAGLRFLDVGAGFGLFSREARRSGFDVECVEVGDLERQCIREFAGVEAEPVMFESFSAPADSFDAILMSQILEHTVDPRSWLTKSASLLRAGGVLAIAVPSFDSIFRVLLGAREMHISPPEHLNFFTARGLSALLSATGFDLQVMDTVTRLPFSSRVPSALRGPTRLAEAVFASLTQATGSGMYLNAFATRREGGVV